MAENSGGVGVPKPRKLWIDSTPFTPEGYADQSSVLVESSPPRLKLKYFSAKPVVDFGSVKIGKTVSRKLVVENPNPYEVEVKVDKFPWKKNFTIDQECFVIGTEELCYLEITWQPSQSGSYRELVMIKYDSGLKVHALIVGHVDSPKKVRTRVRRGVRKRTIKEDLRKSSTKENQSSLVNDTENIDPASLSTSIFEQVGKTSLSINKSSDIHADEFTSTILGERRDFSNLTPLMPFHVVNNGQRDSCGSITAPTSPSGMDVPVIHEAKQSPLSVQNSFSTVQQSPLRQLQPNTVNSLPEPNRETFCIDPNVSKLPSQQSPFKSQNVTGRQTFLLPKESESQIPANLAKSTLSNLNKEKKVNTPLTPRSHRRSRTFVKPASSQPKPNSGISDSQTTQLQSAANAQKVNMLEYALSMIAPTPIDSSSEKVYMDENAPLHDSLEESVIQVNVPVLVTELTNADDEVGDRLSSTHTHDVSSLGGQVGGLPVPDISVIASQSPLKLRKRKSMEVSSPVSKHRAKKLTPCKDDVSKASRRRLNSGAYGTPKGRALQRRRAAKSSETMHIPKPAGILAKKKISKAPTRNAAPTGHDKQKVIKRRKVHMPVTKLILKPSKATPRSPSSPVLVMPYSSTNMFYDEKWRQKQSHAYTMWLNYILTPDEFKPILEAKNTSSSNKSSSKSLNHSDVFGQKSEKLSLTQPAVNKETASFRVYGIQKKFDQLRYAACNLFNSISFMTIARKVEEAVESSRIRLRGDKMWADVGNKSIILELLLSFHPLWLRVCLEVLFQKRLVNNDSYTLSTFITRNLLNCKSIEKEFAHATVPHSFRAGYNDRISKHVLKKFLILIYFLEQAKQNRLIDHDPCLFRKESKFRNCKDILHSFSRDLLRGEGDIIKHLAYIGYKVTYTQTFIDEFDFGINNIVSDLRDGVRLVRITELLFRQHDLTQKLRVPAVSLLQKKHNVEIALKSLESHGVEMCDGLGKKVEADHVVKGSCDMTLALLWNIAAYFQLEKAIDKNLLKAEIEYLKRGLRIKHMMEKTKNFYEEQDTNAFAQSKITGNASLLLEWCRLVCAFQSVPVYNFCASFSDGRVLACLISYYQTNLINSSHIKMETTLSQRDPNLAQDNSEKYFVSSREVSHAQLLRNEKINLKLVQNAAYEMGGIPNLLRIDDICNTIPDDKVVRLIVSFLCNRLLDIGVEDKAARTIQIAWKAYRYKKVALEEIYRLSNAVTVIAAAYRGHKIRKDFSRLKSAVISIQRLWRAKMVSQPYRLEFLKLKSAAISMQSMFRGKQARKHANALREKRKIQQPAAFKIQHCWRGYQKRKEFLIQKNAARKIQRWFRNCKVGISKRNEFLAYKSTVIKMQRRRKLTLEMRKQVAIFATVKEAVILIQSIWRSFQAQKELVILKKRNYAAIVIQTHFRATLVAKQVRNDFILRKEAAIVLQTHFRAILVAKQVRYDFVHKKEVVITIQRHFRATLVANQVRGDFIRMKKAAIAIQTHFRAILVAKQVRTDFINKKNAVITIQRHVRAISVSKQIRNDFIVKKKAVITIQRLVRATLSAKHVRNDFLQKKKAVIVIQTHLRAFLVAKQVRDDFLRRKRAVFIIQGRFRATLLAKQIRNDFIEKKKAVITIQRHVRATLSAKHVRNDFLQKKEAVIVIQTHLRAFLVMKQVQNDFLCRKKAVITIQWRFRATLLAKQIRNDFIEKKKAVITIQRRVRATLSAKHERNNFLQRKKAVKVIQTHLRALLVAKHVRDDFRCKKKAVITIQVRFRATLLAKQVRGDFICKKEAAIAIQTRFRATMLAKQVQNDFMHKKEAAVVIQTHFKATSIAMQVRTDFIYKKRAVITIQRHVRAILVSKQIRNDFIEKKKAVLTIQRHVRATLMAKQVRGEFLCRKRAVITIQRHFRATLHAKRVRYDYICKKEAVIVVQTHFRALLVARHIRTDFIHKKKAVIIIQRHVRAILISKQIQNDFIEKRRAAITIQRRVRATLSAKHVRKDFICRKAAAIVIQTHFRATSVAKQVHTDFICMKKAVIAIQIRFRATVLARQVQNDFIRRKEAAVVIQTRLRATLITKRVRTDFIRTKEAATTIQTRLRAFLVGKQVRKEFIRKKEAANIIQNYFRATLVAKHVREDFIHTKEAAIIFQTRFRATLIAKQVRNDFVCKKAGVITIQRRYRASLVAKQVRADFLRTKRAVIAIQTHFRATLVSRQVRQNFIRQKIAAITIQTHFRTVLVAKKVRDDFICQKNAAAVIQTHYRAILVARLVRDNFICKKTAAVAIQTRFRAALVAKQVRNEFICQKNAAVVIQTHFRAILVARELRENFISTRKAAIVIQNRFRATLVMKQVREDFISRKEAAIVIQRRFRATLVVKQVREDFINKKEAAIIIQKHFRSTLIVKQVREEFVCKKKATVVIQTRFRATLIAKQVRNDFVHKKKAAIIIQTHFHAYRVAKQVRNDYVRNKTAAIAIQTGYRAILVARQVRNDFICRKMAVITIQRHVRVFLVSRQIRSDYIIMKKAAITIQRRVRASLYAKHVRKNFIRRKKAVIVIQTRLRAFLVAKQVRDDFRRKKKAVFTIQEYFRATLLAKQVRTDFIHKKKAVIIIQKRFRATLIARQIQDDFLHKKKAIIAIQRWARVSLVAKQIRTDFIHKKKAAITIQKRFRANIVAKQVREDFVYKKEAAIVFQTRFRAILIAKQVRADFIRKKNAAIVIQERFRVALVVRRIQNEFIQIKKAAIVLQNAWRCVSAKRKLQELRIRHKQKMVAIAMRNDEKAKEKAAITIQCAVRCFQAKLRVQKMREKVKSAIIIQRKWRSALRILKDRRKFLNMRNAVMLLQRVWRGSNVRRSIDDRKILIARRKCAIAYRHAQRHPERRICNRLNEALSMMLDAKSYDAVYATLEDIYSLSSLLTYCCERISEEGGTEVLCQLIMNSNRSLHAAFVQKFSINILLNLLKNPSTRKKTCRILTSNSNDKSPIEQIVSVLSRFRDRSGRDSSHILVFCAACTLLIEFCRDERNVKFLKSNSRSVDMIKYIKKETDNKIKTKMHKNLEVQLKRKRESVGYLALSSSASCNTTLNTINLLDITTRETSFLSNVDTKRVSTPKYKQQKKDLENKEPSTAQKQHKPNPTAKKVVANLFGSETIPPKVKQSIVPARSFWNTNIPIHKSKKATKPQSPKFTGARLKKMPVLHRKNPDQENTAAVSDSAQHSPESDTDIKLITVSHNDMDPVSCINTLSELLV